MAARTTDHTSQLTEAEKSVCAELGISEVDFIRCRASQANASPHAAGEGGGSEELHKIAWLTGVDVAALSPPAEAPASQLTPGEQDIARRMGLSETDFLRNRRV